VSKSPYFSLIWPGIEDLREKRDAVSRQVSKDEDERAKIQTDIRILTERLQRLEGSLGRKAEAVREYDRTITETEAAWVPGR
jgi:Sjoegren syndrome nuclear autoantigen 1